MLILASAVQLKGYKPAGYPEHRGTHQPQRRHCLRLCRDVYATFSVTAFDKGKKLRVQGRDAIVIP